MKRPELMDIYSDYLIASFSLTTATGLSKMLDNGYSHDQISRFLAQELLQQKDYWKMVKKIIRKIECATIGVISIDDTIEEKPHTTENDIVCWHWDHSKNRDIKGINLVNFLYVRTSSDHQNLCIPAAYEIVKKTEQYVDAKSKYNKIKRRSPISKNEMVIRWLRVLNQLNRLKYKYITWDIWFSYDNLKFVHHDIKKYFVSTIKDNHLVALSEDEKRQGKFININKLDLQPNQVISVWLKGLDFPVLIAKQIFISKDNSTGELYIITNDLNLNYDGITTIYKKRWNVETFHKSLKNNASLAKSPTKYEVTQSNHIFASMIAFCKLEILKFKEGLNHFALKSKLYLKAIQAALIELQKLKKCNLELIALQQDTPLLEVPT
jgi:hypothetical protein